MGQALDIVNKFMQQQDVSIVADDFKFIGPVDQTTGKEAFLKLNADFSPMVTGMRMLKQFENGNDVCSIYEMDLNPPNSNPITLTITDWTTVKNGQMVQTRIVYDPREYVTALGR